MERHPHKDHESQPSLVELGLERGDRAATTTKGSYTCPMPPDVRRDAPGSCPTCGMALERVLPASEPSSATTESTTEWTCPMHPEIVREGLTNLAAVYHNLAGER